MKSWFAGKWSKFLIIAVSSAIIFGALGFAVGNISNQSLTEEDIRATIEVEDSAIDSIEPTPTPFPTPTAPPHPIIRWSNS